MVETGSLKRPERRTSHELVRLPSESSLSSVRVLRTSNLQNAVTAANIKDPSFKNDTLWKCSFYIKVTQWAISITCAALYSKGNELQRFSYVNKSLPYVVFFAYILINTVIIFSFIIKEKMPELLIRMFGFLGGVLFAVTGGLNLSIWLFHKAFDEEHLSDLEEIGISDPHISMNCLLAEVILDFTAAALYCIDVTTSYC
ncbi:uncharacterized protein LOC124165597 [Ischnura elegans]|uniref:uncharacterized protein LOC124165597 n=1 Tax=Ischnura elegans TaxID=197161 RepID=UPI001ED86F8C|nr:uncharacterized protein LOC124165597 [Ischnura elegans]